jgi:D-amino-acid dehydrogenase
MSAAPSDVLVIGAGIVGLSCALFLQEDGHAVTLVDPAPPGSGTSSGNAGIISVASVMPIVTRDTLKALPGMLANPAGPFRLRWRYLPSLAPWLLRAALATRKGTVERAMVGIQALASRALRAHEVLVQRAGAGELLRSKGWVKVTLDRAALDRFLATETAALDRFGVAYEVLDRDALHDLEPGLSSEVAGGLWLTSNREISHPQAYSERLAALFFERGGRQERRLVRGLARDGGKVTGVLTNDGTLAAATVVIAAGAFSADLAAAAGHRVPLETERGYHLMLPLATDAAGRPLLGRPVYCMDPGFVLAPMDHGLRLTSGVELASKDAAPDFGIPRRILPIARRYLPGLDQTVLSEWQGCRPSLPDSLPVIGKSRRHPNVLFAFGHQHLGLTLGPITGRIIADLVAGRDPGLDLTAYAPDRRFW